MKDLFKLLDGLHCGINIYHANGKKLYPDTEGELSPSVLGAVSTQMLQVGKQYMQLSTSSPAYIIACAGEENTAKDILYLINKLLQNTTTSFEVNNIQEAYAQILKTQNINPLQIKELASQFALPIEQNYYLFHIVFEPAFMQAYDIVQELYPSDTGDILISLNARSMCILHFVEDSNQYDIYEFVEALALTLQEESGKHFVIGISDFKKSILQLAQAHNEAKKSIAIAEKMELGNQCVFYNNLMLERIVLELPLEQRQQYYTKLFSPETLKALNSEMQLTIRTFLDKDLNLSDTARHLYIHRNTLVYRLEKIQKALGLDLKKFSDASIYKLLSTMYKLSNSNKN
ncbi:MAG: helix-turn-helix domain-containing protein [Eubacteriales bacterium]|nr:helix-turn-helix domain-containing protein [Eubacteriales bacterium]